MRHVQQPEVIEMPHYRITVVQPAKIVERAELVIAADDAVLAEMKALKTAGDAASWREIDGGYEAGEVEVTDIIEIEEGGDAEVRMHDS